MSKISTSVRIIRIAARVSSALTPNLGARWLEHLFLTPLRRPMPTREIGWMATAQRKAVRYDARRLPVYSWGSGPTILLAHGWSGRGSQMGVFVDPLVKRGFRVVTFDAPGHGEADGRQSSLPEIAIAIERVVDNIGPIQAIVAHSLGTAATTIALSRGLSVERLVYIAPPDNPGDYLYRAARYLGFSDEIAGRAQTRIEKRFSFPFERARGTLLAPALDVPLLVIHDLNDPEVPHEEGARLVDAWSGARLMTTNGLGHNHILRAPEVVDAAVGFLCSNREPALSNSFGTVQSAPHSLPCDD